MLIIAARCQLTVVLQDVVNSEHIICRYVHVTIPTIYSQSHVFAFIVSPFSLFRYIVYIQCTVIVELYMYMQQHIVVTVPIIAVCVHVELNFM